MIYNENTDGACRTLLFSASQRSSPSLLIRQWYFSSVPAKEPNNTFLVPVSTGFGTVCPGLRARKELLFQSSVRMHQTYQRNMEDELRAELHCLSQHKSSFKHEVISNINFDSYQNVLCCKLNLDFQIGYVWEEIKKSHHLPVRS